MTAQPRRKPCRVVLDWQPIRTAPKDGRMLWLLEDGKPLGLNVPYQCMGYWFGHSSYEGGGRWAEAVRDMTAQPTHWMPLPDPPKAKR